MILARSVKKNFPAVEHVLAICILQLLSASHAKMATTVSKYIHFQFLIVPNARKLNAKNAKVQKSASNVSMGTFCPKNLILPMEPSSDPIHSA
jgi:hypothetical protein